MFLKEAGIHKIDLNCKNPYEILDIKRQANHKEIKKAYKKLALKYHPDNQDTGDEKIFKLTTKAKNILLDPKLRNLYDEFYIFNFESDKALYNKAMSEITQAFLSGLSKTSDNVDMGSILRELFIRTNTSLVININNTKKILNKYESASNRLNKSKASKAIQEGLTQIINSGKEELSKIKKQLIVIEKAEEILRDFEYDFDPPKETTSINDSVFTLTFSIT